MGRVIIDAGLHSVGQFVVAAHTEVKIFSTGWSDFSAYGQGWRSSRDSFTWFFSDERLA
jgi:hypothetical protein